MRVLVCHNNYPAQFRRLLPFLVEKGHEVVFLHRNKEWHANQIDDIRLLNYGVHRQSFAEALHPYLRRFESSVIEGQGAFRSCQVLLEEGWIPDVVISHAGFGNGLFLAVIPKSTSYCSRRVVYNAFGSDVDL